MTKLVAVFSCEAHRDRNQAIRETWAPAAQKYADVRFFMGHAAEPLPDEVHLDGYEGKVLTWTNKIERILNWSNKSGYEGLLFVDSDTYADPDAIFQSDMTQFDYAGCLVGGEHIDLEPGVRYYGTQFYSFVGAGGSIWMSRKAVSYLLPVLIPTAVEGAKSSTFRVWHTDLWISQILISKYVAGLITMKHEKNCGDGPYSWHLGHAPRPAEEYSRIPEAMREMHQLTKGTR